ncbi:MAG: hypothetical protein DIU69_11860 [Bacillota bacterium]|nr:MAG: hypothetical protein DIU69_11860 [Bacillota bacterium]
MGAAGDCIRTGVPGSHEGGTEMALGPRLRAILEAMGTVACLADIGTDHALLPIAAVRDGRASSAVATDLRPEPLAAARRAVVRAGLEGRIDLRLGYGLRPLRPGEADVVVIAGLNGDTIAEILRDRPDVLRPGMRLLLMPVRRVAVLRRFLRQWAADADGGTDPTGGAGAGARVTGEAGRTGLELRSERLAREGRHVYVLMDVAVTAGALPRAMPPGEAGSASGPAGGAATAAGRCCRLPPAAEGAARELMALARSWDLPADAACDAVGPVLLANRRGGPDPLLDAWLEELARPWRRAARLNTGSTPRAGQARETAERWLGFLRDVGLRWAAGAGGQEEPGPEPPPGEQSMTNP